MFYNWLQHTPEMEPIPWKTEAKDGEINSILAILCEPLHLAMPEIR